MRRHRGHGPGPCPHRHHRHRLHVASMGDTPNGAAEEVRHRLGRAGLRAPRGRVGRRRGGTRRRRHLAQTRPQLGIGRRVELGADRVASILEHWPLRLRLRNPPLLRLGPGPGPRHTQRRHNRSQHHHRQPGKAPHPAFPFNSRSHHRTSSQTGRTALDRYESNGSGTSTLCRSDGSPLTPSTTAEPTFRICKCEETRTYSAHTHMSRDSDASSWRGHVNARPPQRFGT